MTHNNDGLILKTDIDIQSIDSIVRVDSLDDNKFYINISGNKINIIDSISIFKCQIAPCELCEASRIVLELSEFEDCVNVKNIAIDDCYVDLLVDADSMRTIKNYFDNECRFKFYGINNSKNFDISINNSDSSVTIENHSNYSIFIRCIFPIGKNINLKRQDKIVTSDEIVVLSIKDNKFDFIPGEQSWEENDDVWD